MAILVNLSEVDGGQTGLGTNGAFSGSTSAKVVELSGKICHTITLGRPHHDDNRDQIPSCTANTLIFPWIKAYRVV